MRPILDRWLMTHTYMWPFCIQLSELFHVMFNILIDRVYAHKMMQTVLLQNNSGIPS